MCGLAPDYPQKNGAKFLIFNPNLRFTPPHSKNFLYFSFLLRKSNKFAAFMHRYTKNLGVQDESG